MLKLIWILDGAGIMEAKKRDFESGEPRKWPVVKSAEIRYNIEAPTPH
jgi:hypothetical protein